MFDKIIIFNLGMNESTHLDYFAHQVLFYNINQKEIATQ